MPDDAVWTEQVALCEDCMAIVKVYMDSDGNRWCGKGKHPFSKGSHITIKEEL